MLPTLYQATLDYDVDIALVIRDLQGYTAAIAERRELQAASRVWPEELAEGLREKARKLADRAKRGELVLFLGAGVSAGAGLPTWDQLLEDLARKAEVFASNGSFHKGLIDDFKALTHLDRARLISDYFQAKEICGNDQAPIGKMVSDHLRDHHCYSIAHSALATLPVCESVTTNYDVLFEAASTYPPTNEPPPVLPYDPPKPGERWVLKLHGCMTRPEDIVLTRSDYLRYDDTRAALKGIVQALLITRHMLFVGFSLTDDNFHSKRPAKGIFTRWGCSAIMALTHTKEVMMENRTAHLASEEKRSSWTHHLEQWKSSGLTQVEYCRRNGLNRKSFTYWRRKFRKESATVCLVEVPMAHTPAEPLCHCPVSVLRLVVGGRYRVEVERNFDSEALEQLIGFLERR